MRKFQILSGGGGTGIIGIGENSVTARDTIDSIPKSSNLNLRPTTHRNTGFGIAMFFYKESYAEIPNDIKIFCGDDWILYKNKRAGRQNYIIEGAEVFHLGSLTSSNKTFNPICSNDIKLYKKLTIKWYHRLFSVEETWNAFKIRLLGVTFILRKKNKN